MMVAGDRVSVSLALIIAGELLLFILNQRIIKMMDISTPTTVTINTLTTTVTALWEDSRLTPVCLQNKISLWEMTASLTLKTVNNVNL